MYTLYLLYFDFRKIYIIMKLIKLQLLLHNQYMRPYIFLLPYLVNSKKSVLPYYEVRLWIKTTRFSI